MKGKQETRVPSDVLKRVNQKDAQSLTASLMHLICDVGEVEAYYLVDHLLAEARLRLICERVKEKPDSAKESG